MRFIAGPLNKQLLQNLLAEVIEPCTRVRAAVAYANRDNLQLFEASAKHLKPLEFFGRYDYTVAVDPAVLKWFLDKASPNFDCKLVPDILHAKVIWWVDAGAYIGSANLSDRAWISNIEAGTFLSHDELVETGMERELLHFFEEVDDRARPLTKEIYQEQLRLADRRSDIAKRDYGLEQQFDKDRLLPKNQGLVFVDTKRSSEKRFHKFEQDWNDTLQVMRAIAARVSAPGAKPGWIDASVAPGVQADQFLHAYYYKQVKDGNRHPYEEFFARNSKNPEMALRDALDWWHAADFDHSFEERTIYEWSPRLHDLLARDRILKLSEEEFVDAISRVHAIRDHAIKQENEHLGLPDSPQLLYSEIGTAYYEKFGFVALPSFEHSAMTNEFPGQTGLTLRAADAADEPKMIELHEASWDPNLVRIVRTPELLRYFRFRNTPNHAWILERNGVVVGYVISTLHDGTRDDGVKPSQRTLWVDEWAAPGVPLEDVFGALRVIAEAESAERISGWLSPWHETAPFVAGHRHEPIVMACALNEILPAIVPSRTFFGSLDHF